MKKNSLFGVFVIVLVLVFVIDVFALAQKPPASTTMMVVPSRYSVIQVAQDLAAKFKVVVVAYQTVTDSQPILHVWNSKEWLPVTFADYQSGKFLSGVPSHTLLVGDESLLPQELVAASSWCRNVMNIPDTGTSDIINAMGKIIPFTPADWRWVARRYDLKLVDLNKGQRRDSWYDQNYMPPHSDNEEPVLPPFQPTTSSPQPPSPHRDEVEIEEDSPEVPAKSTAHYKNIPPPAFKEPEPVYDVPEIKGTKPHNEPNDFEQSIIAKTKAVKIEHPDYNQLKTETKPPVRELKGVEISETPSQLKEKARSKLPETASEQKNNTSWIDYDHKTSYSEEADARLREIIKRDRFGDNYGTK